MTEVRLLRRCVVVGGAGAVGGLFARSLRGRGAEVVVADPAAGSGDATDPDSALIATLAEADLVLLAVGERTALTAIRALRQHLRPGTLLADTLSVKRAVVPALRAVRDVQAVSLNPMFAPALGFPGNPVAAVVVHSGPRVAELLSLLADWGARPVRMSAVEHDRIAAATQALTHATVLGFGLALSELGVSVDELSPVAPPPHRTLLALLARMAAGTPEVYWDIQSANPHAARARTALAGGVRRVADLVETGDVAAFTAALHGLRGFFGDHLARQTASCARLFDGLSAPSGIEES